MIRFGYLLLTLSFLIPIRLSAYTVTLHGGPSMDIPEAWYLNDEDPSIPKWYAPDESGVVEAVLWAPGTWAEIDTFVKEVQPTEAEGNVVIFPYWDGQVALADWSFSTSEGRFRGWFLLVRGSGPDVRIAAVASEANFLERQPFLLSAIDTYAPSEAWRRNPGVISRFLELTGEEATRTVHSDFHGELIVWEESPAGNQASQDIIEREALVLASYGAVPELFYEAWKRYYRIIYRDSYQRLEPLAWALENGPLPSHSYSKREVAEALLSWLQGFTYGSTNGFSDLLAPSIACSSRTGDCDSLSLALIILLEKYGIDGKLLISHQARHALTALNLPGEGMYYAELTSVLPLGVLPDRLIGVDDWLVISLVEEE